MIVTSGIHNVRGFLFWVKVMREEVLELLKSDAYKKGEYTLASGRKSEHYVNCKPVTLTARGLTLVSLMFLEFIEKESKAVAGLTLGADPLVSGVAVVSALEHRMIDALIVRKEAKGHGTGAWIEGKLPSEGSRVKILEDVVTTGGSSIKAVEKLRDAGYVVERVVAIVNRQEGTEADDAMKKAGLELFSIFSLEELTK